MSECPDIVVGVDGSTASLTATSWAARTAARSGNLLTVCLALSSEDDHPRQPENVPLGELREETAERIVADARCAAHAVATTVRTRGMVMNGHATDLLVRLTRGSALLVVGQHGADWFPHLALGSVASQLAAHADCPVVVTREKPARDDQPVIVGVDGPDAAQPALRFAFEAAARDEVRVFAILAYGVPLRQHAELPAHNDLLHEHRRLAAEQLATAMAPWIERFPGVPTRSEVIHGPASRSLVEASRRASLVVVGARGRGGFPGLRLGSVTQHVLALATCPVAVAR